MQKISLKLNISFLIQTNFGLVITVGGYTDEGKLNNNSPRSLVFVLLVQFYMEFKEYSLVTIIVLAQLKFDIIFPNSSADYR